MLGRFTEDRNGQSHEVTECFYEISLNDSIQQLLHVEAVKEQVL